MRQFDWPLKEKTVPCQVHLEKIGFCWSITSIDTVRPACDILLGSGHHWPFWKQSSYTLLKAFQGPSSSQAVMLNSEETFSPSFPTGMELCLVRTIAICFRRPSASFAWSRGVPEPTREGMVRVGDYMLPRCAGKLFAIVFVRWQLGHRLHFWAYVPSI